MDVKFEILIYGTIMLVSGSLNTLISKFQYNTKAAGLPDHLGDQVRQFEHPWLQTNLMFIAEIICLIVLFIKYLASAKEKKKIDDNRKNLGWRTQALLGIPAMCDFVATVMSSVGLLWVDSSVFQMLRGSLIIFVGILSKLVFKRKMVYEQWAGIASSALGITLVSLSSIFGKTGTNTDSFHLFLGIAFIVGAQCLSAVQMIVEELYLGQKQLDPLNVVGMEGVFGFIFCSIAIIVTYFLPGDSGPNHRQEDILDAFIQLSNSTALVLTTILYIVSIAFYNYSGVSVSKKFSATHRTLLDCCRTVIIWLVGVIMYYGFGLTQYGEPLDYWSITKVDGFVLLIIGTVLYQVIGKGKQEGETHTLDKNKEPDDEERAPLIHTSDKLSLADQDELGLMRTTKESEQCKDSITVEKHGELRGATPTEEPVRSRGATPTEEPVRSRVATPTGEPVRSRVATPTEEPVIAEVVAPNAEPVIAEVVAPNAEPEKEQDLKSSDKPIPSANSK